MKSNLCVSCGQPVPAPERTEEKATPRPTPRSEWGWRGMDPPHLERTLDRRLSALLLEPVVTPALTSRHLQPWREAMLAGSSHREDVAVVVLLTPDGGAAAPSRRDQPLVAPPIRRRVGEGGQLQDEALTLVGWVDAAEGEKAVVERAGLHLEWAHFDPERERWVGCLCSEDGAQRLEQRSLQGSFPWGYELAPSEGARRWLVAQRRGSAPALLALSTYLQAANARRLMRLAVGVG